MVLAWTALRVMQAAMGVLEDTVRDLQIVLSVTVNRVTDTTG